MSAQISAQIQQLTQQLAAIQAPEVTPGTRMVHSREVAGGAHFLYESIRNATEFREQHLFIRRAIERFLHRRLRLNHGLTGSGEELVIELINTRYVKNDSVPMAVAKHIDQVLERYAMLHQRLLAAHRNPATQIGVTDNLLEIASVDIEHLVVPHPKEELVLNFAYKSFLEHLDDQEIARVTTDRPTFDLTLLAVIHRILLKSDAAVIRHALFTRQYPEWQHNEAELSQAVHDFIPANQHFSQIQTGSVAARINRMVRRNIVPYIVLRQALVDSADPAALVAEPVRLGSRITAICQQQYRAAQKKLRDGVVRSIIFLLATKAVLALVLEIPFDIFLHGEIQWIPLIINFVVPPAYMATLGSGVKVPSARNTQRIRQGAEALVYPSVDNPVNYRLPKPVTGGRATLFSLVYGLTFLISFSVIIWILYALHYNVVSAAIFFIFLSTVSFLGFRVSQSANELVMVDERRGILSALADFFYTPFVRIGQVIAANYAKVNVVSLFLDILIELPLKTVLRIFEQWIGFIREKREDIY